MPLYDGSVNFRPSSFGLAHLIEMYKAPRVGILVLNDSELLALAKRAYVMLTNYTQTENDSSDHDLFSPTGWQAIVLSIDEVNQVFDYFQALCDKSSADIWATGQESTQQLPLQYQNAEQRLEVETQNLKQNVGVFSAKTFMYDPDDYRVN